MAISVTFDWNEEDLKKLLELTHETFEEAFKLLATDLWGNIRREAPTDHGRLAGSFDMSQMSALEYRIVSGVEYALWVHEGTGIYGPAGIPILPISASVLVFDWQGTTWFLKSVKGQEANKFVDRAVETTEAHMSDFIDIAIAKMGV